MKTKECPSCAMEVDQKSKICPICQYEFAEVSTSYRWIAIVLIVIMLLYLFFVVLLKQESIVINLHKQRSTTMHQP